MIQVVGIGPGDLDYLIPLAKKAVENADVIVGYTYYFDFIKPLISATTTCIGKELSKEALRAEIAIKEAGKGKNVVVIGSGDASVYSMASIVYEKLARNGEKINVQTIPGISAFIAAGARLGAVLGHDFCTVSLSDLMTPWETIEKRITAAAMGDFVTVIYNPKSATRYWQLDRLKNIFLAHRTAENPVAICRQLMRKDEKITLTKLKDLTAEKVDMFSLVVIGNSQTFQNGQHLITPRGYLNRKPHTGREIQKESFAHILKNIPPNDLEKDALWAAVRCIHTAGDFDYINHFKASKKAIEHWQKYLHSGGVIVCDVTMVVAGITKAFTQQCGNEIVCLLNDPETLELAEKENLTRSQAGIKRAIQKYPNALFVIGNAPTALIEICDQIQMGTCKPTGVIGAPVGFVNVLASKARLETVKNTQWAMVTGNKGGSNFAATIVNAAFSYKH